MSIAAQPFCRQVNDYSGLINACRERTKQMQLSRAELDHVAGLQEGYAGKLLSTNPVKKLGLTTLGPILESLGLTIVLMENPAARDRTLSRRTPVEARNQRMDKDGRERARALSVTQSKPPKVEAPQPPRDEPAMHSHLRVVQTRHALPLTGRM